jgi:hypothetical protein
MPEITTLVLDLGSGEKGRTEKCTVQEENDLLLLYHDGNPRFLSFDIKEWSLDRRPQNPSIQRRWHPTFHLEMGTLKPPVVALTYGPWSWRELRLSPGMPPL